MFTDRCHWRRPPIDAYTTHPQSSRSKFVTPTTIVELEVRPTVKRTVYAYEVSRQYGNHTYVSRCKLNEDKFKSSRPYVRHCRQAYITLSENVIDR